MLLNLDNMGKTTWVSHIRNILFSHGFGFVWLHQTVGNISLFLRKFREQSVDMYYQDWHHTLETSSRYDMYRRFKSLIQPEKYLSVLTSRNLRRDFIQYRLGLSDLFVNKGRRLAIEKCLRLCPLCHSSIENEIHFTFVCPAYVDLRTQYIPMQYLSKYPETAFVSILSSSNDNVILQLALYVKHALSLRNELLNTD